MSLMDAVQILIVLLLLLLGFRPLYARWLPAGWRNISWRLLAPRALKYEGTWQRKTTKMDEDD